MGWQPFICAKVLDLFLDGHVYDILLYYCIHIYIFITRYSRRYLYYTCVTPYTKYIVGMWPFRISTLVHPRIPIGCFSPQEEEVAWREGCWLVRWISVGCKCRKRFDITQIGGGSKNAKCMAILRECIVWVGNETMTPCNMLSNIWGSHEWHPIFGWTWWTLVLHLSSLQFVNMQEVEKSNRKSIQVKYRPNIFVCFFQIFCAGLLWRRIVIHELMGKKKGLTQPNWEQSWKCWKIVFKKTYPSSKHTQTYIAS